MFRATWYGMFSFDIFLFGELHRHSLHLKQLHLWLCWWLNPEDCRQDYGGKLCCNPNTEHTDYGDGDLYMFDYADADFTLNWSLPIVKNIVWKVTWQNVPQKLIKDILMQNINQLKIAFYHQHSSQKKCHLCFHTIVVIVSMSSPKTFNTVSLTLLGHLKHLLPYDA